MEDHLKSTKNNSLKKTKAILYSSKWFLSGSTDLEAECAQQHLPQPHRNQLSQIAGYSTDVLVNRTRTPTRIHIKTATIAKRRKIKIFAQKFYFYIKRNV